MPPELAETALSAVDAWEDGTSYEYQASVVVSQDCVSDAWCLVLVDHISECNAQAYQGADEQIGGCTEVKRKRIEIVRGLSADLTLSLLMHEIGHSVGLPDDLSGSGGLMDPHRSTSGAAVDADTLAAFRAEMAR
ncbi:MAG TPA: hypothetical protein VIU86_20085 [Gaiellaceae bacterium]